MRKKRKEHKIYSRGGLDKPYLLKVYIKNPFKFDNGAFKILSIFGFLKIVWWTRRGKLIDGK